MHCACYLVNLAVVLRALRDNGWCLLKAALTSGRHGLRRKAAIRAGIVSIRNKTNSEELN